MEKGKLSKAETIIWEMLISAKTIDDKEVKKMCSKLYKTIKKCTNITTEKTYTPEEMGAIIDAIKLIDKNIKKYFYSEVQK